MLKSDKRARTRSAEIKPQYTILDEEGGYITLHPTKGWKRVSGQRVRAREMMFERFGFIR